MKRLFGSTVAVSILCFSASWMHNNIVAKQRYLENSEQGFDRGKHSRPNVELRNAIQIDPDLTYAAVFTDSGPLPESNAYRAKAEAVPSYLQDLQVHLEPAQFHLATDPREDARHKASPLLTSEKEAARERSQLTEPAMVIGDPAYLTLFGFGLTIMGFVLLRRSRLAKPSKIATMRATPSRIYVQLAGNSDSRLILTSEFTPFPITTVNHTQRAGHGPTV
jgi:hypothetical protein